MPTKAIPEKFSFEKDNQNVIIYQLDRFTKSIMLTIYIKISSLSDDLINYIDITSDQGPGQEYKKLAPLSLGERIGLVLISFGLGMCVTVMSLVIFALIQ